MEGPIIAKPTITYGHVLLIDCTDTTDWVETESGLASTLEVENDDTFKITGTCDNVADEYVFYEKQIDPFSSDTYPKFLIRYKTSVGSNGCGVKLALMFMEDPKYALADDGGVFTDETTAATNDTADDMTLLPAVPAVNDAYYFGSDNTFEGINLIIGTSGEGVWTITWEYETNLGVWTALTNVEDKTASFTAATGSRTVYFTVPGDWGKTVVDGKTAYWIRGRVSAYTSKVTIPKGTRVYVVPDHQVILDTSFSTTWTELSGTITAGKTVGAIRLYADDSPNTIDTGTYYCWLDFLLLHQGTFTFPSLKEVLPKFENRYADIGILGRLGDRSQYGGAPSDEFILRGDIKSDTGWGTPLLEILYQIKHEAFKESWQWFTSDLACCKVTLRGFDPTQIGEDAQRVWELRLKRFDGHCGSNEWVWDYYGLK